MNVLEIQTLACGAYGWFQQALIRLCVCAAVALFAVMILRTQTVRDAAARIAALWCEAAHWMRLVAMSLVFGFVLYAGTKTHSLQLQQMPLTPLATGGTPVVPVVSPPSATGGTPVVPEVVTPEEIAQGWRIESVTTNDAVSYAMPSNGVEYSPWSLGGGYEMHFPLDLGDDFGFPFGTGVVRRIDVLSGGMVESLPRQRPTITA